MQTRVVDLTVELTGETKTYTVPESQNVAKAMGITLSTSIDPIMNELNAIKSTSQEIIDSVDAHRAKIEACESILEDINPAFKQTREQDRKIAGIENKVNDLTDSFEDLKKLIVEHQKYVDTYGYHFSNALADEAVKKMVNVDGSKRIWKQPEIKDIFEKCGAKKPDKATWGDVQYVFAMYYSDGFPKVFKCENELVKATLMYLDDPDAPEGVAFIRWLAVQDYLGEKINWKDLT